MQDLSKKYHALLEENALLKQQIQELEKSSSSHQALFAGSSKRAEDRLKETENKYKLLTDKMCDVGWISDMNLRTVFVTPSIQTVLGYSREERMGQTVDQQLTPDSLNRALTLLSRELDLEKQGPIDPDRILNIELEFYHQNGTTRWLDVIINGIRDRQGVLNGFHGVARDITDRKQAEDALKKAHEQLEMHVKERTQELANVIDTLTKHKHLLADESKRLQETNTALKVLLRQREEDQQDFERKVLANVRNLVLPYLEKIKSTPLGPAQIDYVDILSANLENIVSPFLRNLTATYMDFTPREIDVANLVRQGKSAKDIALLLNSSIRSIEFHKDNIRRKLGLTHQKINLRTYLLSLNKNDSKKYWVLPDNNLEKI